MILQSQSPQPIFVLCGKCYWCVTYFDKTRILIDNICPRCNLDAYEAFKHFVNLNRPYYDLVITDIRMPGLNGLQLYQNMKSIDNSVNIIFVSALDALQELVSIFPDVNLDNIIRKPVTREEFLNKVKTAIGQRQRANVKLNNNNRTKTRSHSKLNNNVI